VTGATLDTLAVSKRLAAAGFSTQQADAVTDALREARELDLAQLATKPDLAQLEANLRAEIATVRTEIASLENRLTVRLGAMTVGGFAIVAATVALF
jgi:hypothetical protein